MFNAFLNSLSSFTLSIYFFESNNPINELVKNITNVDKTCFVLKGLCIEGAEWSYDENKLIMTDSLFSQLPPFLLKWSIKWSFKFRIYFCIFYDKRKYA